jgi:hypothetical protein
MHPVDMHAEVFKPPAALMAPQLVRLGIVLNRAQNRHSGRHKRSFLLVQKRLSIDPHMLLRHFPTSQTACTTKPLSVTAASKITKALRMPHSARPQGFFMTAQPSL